MSGTEKELREILSKLSSEADVMVDVPEFICSLAKHIPNGLTSEGKSIEENALRNGGGIHYHALSDNCPEGVLFHCSGKDMSTLVATKVDINNEETLAASFLEPNLISSEYRNFPTKLYQISTQRSSHQIYCAMRQATAINLGSVNCNADGNVAVEITDTKASNAYITDLALSPFVDGDYLYVTAEGIFYFINMEMGINICKHSLLQPSNDNNTPSWWSCQFASHPRCCLFGNESNVLLRDLRVSSRQCTSLFNFSSDVAYVGEKLCTVKRSLSSAYLYYIGTSYALNLLDERFPNHPVLTWKHQMTSPPIFCSLTTYLTKESESCEAIVLASHASKEVVLFNVHHQGTYKATSLSPPLHISAPGDFVDTLLQNCYSVDPLIKLRTDAKLHGINCISSNAEQVTVLQLTAAGDVFYQDFDVHNKENGIPVELGHKQGPGYVACHLDDEFARRVLAWTEEATVPLNREANCLPSTEDGVDASRLLKSLTEVPEHTHGCPLCCHCPKHYKTSAGPTTICAACGIELHYGQQLCNASEQNGVLAGSLPEKFGEQANARTDPALKMSVDNLSTSNDPLIQRLLDVWTKEEPVSDIDKEICLQILPDFDSQTSSPQPSNVNFGESAKIPVAYFGPMSLTAKVSEEVSGLSADNMALSLSSYQSTSSMSQEISDTRVYEVLSDVLPYCVEAEGASGPSSQIRFETHGTGHSAKKARSSTPTTKMVTGGRVEGF